MWLRHGKMLRLCQGKMMRLRLPFYCTSIFWPVYILYSAKNPKLTHFDAAPALFIASAMKMMRFQFRNMIFHDQFSSVFF
jgi:hypothetical protein